MIELCPKEIADLYTLEHSQYSEDYKKFPFHIQTLNETVEENMSDCLHNGRESNKWQVIFVGTQEKCQQLMDALIEKKGIELGF